MLRIRCVRDRGTGKRDVVRVRERCRVQRPGLEPTGPEQGRTTMTKVTMRGAEAPKREELGPHQEGGEVPCSASVV